MKHIVSILFLILWSFTSTYGQKKEKFIEEPIMDSTLLVLTLNDPTVKGYFTYNLYDTIFLVENQFTENVLDCDISSAVGKIVIFISREEIPEFPIRWQRHIVLEISLIRQDKKTIRLFVTNARFKSSFAFIVLKKRGKKYIKIENGYT